ncbi:AraC-like DNA-binding protein [Aquimarina sp. MAR_2010_214]|uniref:helix-turn-helix domain-containing protein n=1 Tax=Aquimarina sp. MAR_2010_214 TaxID=1250026 RepID=UPI000C6FF317|nr:helix-turn-helix domain-containing protein [Aquimarina sp. MAR_2010_214]PKV53170.1 AraC-like DNA-binding protein [Aquimarina sp. MAR_2010_214]
MSWLDDNFLISILIIQLLVTDMALVLIFVDFRNVQKKKKKASDVTLKKMEKEFKEIRCELREKRRNLDLSYGLVNEFKKRLIRLMEEEKPFRNADLKLADLASKLGISTHQTSQIINQKFGQSFNTFINMYRITEAIRIFRCGTCSNFYDILFDVGFNNEETFNKAFKNYTNKTPIEFGTENDVIMNSGLNQFS